MNFNFLNRNKEALRECNLITLANFEALTASVLRSNPRNYILARIIRSHGWNGKKYRQTAEVVLNLEVLHSYPSTIHK